MGKTTPVKESTLTNLSLTHEYNVFYQSYRVHIMGKATLVTEGTYYNSDVSV